MLINDNDVYGVNALYTISCNGQYTLWNKYYPYFAEVETKLYT